MTIEGVPDGWTTTTVTIDLTVALPPEETTATVAAGILENLGEDWWNASNGCLFIVNHQQAPDPEPIYTVQVPDGVLISWPDDDNIVAYCLGEFLDADDAAIAELNQRPVLRRADYVGWEPACPKCQAGIVNESDTIDTRQLLHVDLEAKAFIFGDDPSYSDSDAGVMRCRNGHLIDLPGDDAGWDTRWGS